MEFLENFLERNFHGVFFLTIQRQQSVVLSVGRASYEFDLFNFNYLQVHSTEAVFETFIRTRGVDIDIQRTANFRRMFAQKRVRAECRSALEEMGPMCAVRTWLSSILCRSRRILQKSIHFFNSFRISDLLAASRPCEHQSRFIAFWNAFRRIGITVSLLYSPTITPRRKLGSR